MQGLDMKKTNRTAQTISSRSLPMGVHHILIFISFSLTVSPEEGQLFYTTPTVSKTAPQRQINIGYTKAHCRIKIHPWRMYSEFEASRQFDWNFAFPDKHRWKKYEHTTSADGAIWISLIIHTEKQDVEW